MRIRAVRGTTAGCVPSALSAITGHDSRVFEAMNGCTLGPMVRALTRCGFKVSTISPSRLHGGRLRDWQRPGLWLHVVGDEPGADVGHAVALEVLEDGRRHMVDSVHRRPADFDKLVKLAPVATWYTLEAARMEVT